MAAIFSFFENQRCQRSEMKHVFLPKFEHSIFCLKGQSVNHLAMREVTYETIHVKRELINLPFLRKIGSKFVDGHLV